MSSRFCMCVCFEFLCMVFGGVTVLLEQHFFDLHMTFDRAAFVHSSFRFFTFANFSIFQYCFTEQLVNLELLVTLHVFVYINYFLYSLACRQLYSEATLIF